MTNEKIIEELETLRLNLHDELSTINGKHAILVQQLAYINNLIYRIKEGEIHEEDDQTSHAES